jgi:hypothetical protein
MKNLDQLLAIVPKEVIELWLKIYSTEFEDSSKTLISFFNVTAPQNQKYILNEKIRLGKDAGKSVLWYLAYQALLTKDSLPLLNVMIKFSEDWSGFDLSAYGEIEGQRITTAELLQKLCNLKLLPPLDKLMPLPQMKSFLPAFQGLQISGADKEATIQEEARNKTMTVYYN